jgi:putative thioredoxin
MEPLIMIAFVIGTILVVVSFAAKPVPPKLKSEFIRDIEVDEFESVVIATSRHTPVIVDFWASWCGPCQILGPRLESATLAQNGKVLLAKVDIDLCPELAEQFQVQAVPTVVFMKNGQEIERFSGVRAEPELHRMVARLLV